MESNINIENLHIAKGILWQEMKKANAENNDAYAIIFFESHLALKEVLKELGQCQNKVE